MSSYEEAATTTMSNTNNMRQLSYNNNTDRTTPTMYTNNPNGTQHNYATPVMTSRTELVKRKRGRPKKYTAGESVSISVSPVMLLPPTAGGDSGGG